MLQTLESVRAPVSADAIRERLARVPRVRLALLPTPLEEAPRLAAAIGIGRLFIKRDDLTGLAFGGNKARNLEFRLAEAVDQQADVFIAGLEAQSNSARMSTAAAVRLGMRSILVLRADPDLDWQGNLLVDRLLGRRGAVRRDRRARHGQRRDGPGAPRDRGRGAPRRAATVRDEPRQRLRRRLCPGLRAVHARDRRAGEGAGDRAHAPVHGVGQQGSCRADRGHEAARPALAPDRDQPALRGGPRFGRAQRRAPGARGHGLGDGSRRAGRRELRRLRRDRVRRTEPARDGGTCAWRREPRA